MIARYIFVLLLSLWTFDFTFSATIDSNAVISNKSDISETNNSRMDWWRNAKFGMFIHWGTYAVPAGRWNDVNTHGEWIREKAHIPLEQYNKFATQFNPINFDANSWVLMAKEAGMKYIVITVKHHDGFCLWDSKFTDYDVMDATPYKRDILEQLAKACKKTDIKLCFYYSIMDWHHPDYLPRRKWENRPVGDADFDRYVGYMKAQLAELIHNYGPLGVLWFDGEWEDTWTPQRGADLYKYVRSLQPDIIINNRVGKGRKGMSGTFDPNIAVGDFGTPEQQIPATGLRYDWETCMTMNNHWGYNAVDKDFKSAQDLIRKLIDTSSKGGNFLLNVGPRADGTFPPESVERLKEIGSWMKINGKSIYDTKASIFPALPFGCSTTKGNTIYLHIFNWPEDAKLHVPISGNQPTRAYLLTDDQKSLNIASDKKEIIIDLSQVAPDPITTTVAVEFSNIPGQQ
jgi:alpha-L-fucosidase